MRKLSDAQILALRKKGQLVKADDGGVYLPKPKVGTTPEHKKEDKEEKEPEKAIELTCVVEQDKELAKAVLAVLSQSEANAAKLATVVSELAKPKAKKKYMSRISRDVNGQIITISTEEK